MTHIAVIGGSDAGISAALRARELDPTVEVTVVVADAHPQTKFGLPGQGGHRRRGDHRRQRRRRQARMPQRLGGERFINTVRRIGIAPFKTAADAQRHITAPLASQQAAPSAAV